MANLVLIGDIVASRRIKNRSEIQNKLLTTFKKINSKNLDLASPLTITLGDEFQAVYNKSDSLFNNIWKILLSIYPGKIRFSLGLGKITTKINPKQAIGMDGPAFYNARKGLEEIKQTSFLFNISGNEDDDIELVKQTLFLLSYISSDWKETRLRVLSLLFDRLSVNEIASRLQVTDKAVYKNIDAGALQTIIKLTEEISKSINSYLKKK